MEEYTFISSNQIKISFIHVARSHNHIASVSFPVCMVKDTLCPQTFNPCEEKLDVLGKKRKLSSGRELKKKKKKKRWKKPQEERPRMDPSPRTEIHAVDVACMEKDNTVTIYKLH